MFHIFVLFCSVCFLNDKDIWNNFNESEVEVSDGYESDDDRMYVLEIPETTSLLPLYEPPEEFLEEKERIDSHPKLLPWLSKM